MDPQRGDAESVDMVRQRAVEAFGRVPRGDVYAGAPQSSSAAQFGTMGINFRARKAHDEAEWGEALATLTCDM